MRLKTKFQDEDFDLGEVVDANIYNGGDGKLKVIAEAAKGGVTTFYFGTLKEVNEMFEDYEELKEHWAIDQFGEPINVSGLNGLQLGKLHRLGNDFPSKNATMKAIEKLKALTEAKEDGLKIKGYYYNHEDLVILADIGKCNKLTLDTLFGGEE